MAVISPSDTKTASQKLWDSPEKKKSSSESRNADISAHRYIDHQLGMKYSGDSEELYVEIMKAFAESSEDNMEKLERSFKDEDFKNYGIYVHSLKSTSMTIGAAEVSELAKKLEFNSQNGEYDEIRKDHGRLMEMYHELVAEIEEKIG